MLGIHVREIRFTATCFFESFKISIKSDAKTLDVATGLVLNKYGNINDIFKTAPHSREKRLLNRLIHLQLKTLQRILIGYKRTFCQ